MIEIIPTVELDKFTKPKKAREGDAGYDVFATSRRWTKNFIEYGIGFRSEMPLGLKGIIVPRSSISKYDLVMCNSPAQIDAGYKHEWLVRFKHLTNKSIDLSQDSPEVVDEILNSENVYKVGDKIAQVFFEYVTDLDIANVEEGKEEREGGFGSTGI